MLSLDRVKVVRDVGTASGPGPILVVDGDARPVGWADPQRPGRVFPLGSTFSPETDSLRVALDSALTSPHGLAVAVTADTRRYAGVLSADTILAKVKEVRVSIAESIAIREAEAAQAYEALAEPADGPAPLVEPEQADESIEVYDQLAEPEQPYESQQVYDQLAELDQADEPTDVYDPLGDQQQAYESHQVRDQQAEPDQADEPTDVYDPLAISSRPTNRHQVHDRQGEAEQAYESDQVQDPRGRAEQAYESDQVQEPQEEPERRYESGHVQDQREQPEQAYEWDQIYDQLAESGPLSHVDPNENSAGGLQGDVGPRPHVDAQGGNGIDSLAGLNYPEDEASRRTQGIRHRGSRPT